MSPQTSKRRASASRDPPPKRRAPVIYISSDDGSPPARRALAPRPEEGRGTFPASKPIGHRSRGFLDYEDGDDENLLAAMKQFKLLRSWFDAGIEMATREMADDERHVRLAFALRFKLLISSQKIGT